MTFVFFLFASILASSTAVAALPNDYSCVGRVASGQPSVSLLSADRVLASPSFPDCEPPKVGSFRDVRIHWSESPTEVTHRYRLKRLSNNHYEVVFHLEFYPDGPANDEDGALKAKRRTDKDLTARWRTKVKECLSKLSGKTKGPDGEHLDFSIYEGPRVRPAPPLNRIGMREQKSSTVLTEHERANSKSWTDDLDCPTIVHELLHLTGLVDEYPENQLGYVKDQKTGNWSFVERNAEHVAFDCRKIFPTNSIMASEKLHWQTLDPHWRVRINFCSCTHGNEERCKDFYKARSLELKKSIAEGAAVLMSGPTHYPESCPSGFAPGKYSEELSIPNELKEKFDKGYPMGFRKPREMPEKEFSEMPPVSYSFAKVSGESLLEARHFNAIVFPGCRSKNEAYYQDSRNAYRTSTARGGEGCLQVQAPQGVMK